MSIRPHIQSELDATDAELGLLQPHWPNAILLKHELRSAYYFLPYFFLEAFPTLTPPAVRPLARFGRLLAGAAFVQDKLVDRAASGSAAQDSLRIMAMQHEAYVAAQELFPAGARFWDRLRGDMSKYAEACLEERRFASGERPWREYTEEVGLGILLGKNGLARTIVAGLVEQGAREELYAPLSKMVDAFNTAAQIWDDLQDWKDDLRQGIPSLLLARVVSERPTGLDDAAWHQLSGRVARAIFYEGHARQVIHQALAALRDAEALKDAFPDLAWYDTTRIYRLRFQSLDQDIDRIVRANVHRARRPPQLMLELPEATSPWQGVAWDAVRFLVRQWRLDFGEARDMMQYPKEMKLGPWETVYFGDVFQRALITDALADTDGVVREQLQSLLDSEVLYLGAQRLPTETGGWNYFPNLEKLPPDADTLGQVIQAALRAGRREVVAAHAEAPLRVLLRDNARLDGAFDTWIVPASGRTELEEQHAVLVQRLWEPGPHNDVIPNLLFALHLYDPARFSDVIRRGAGYLARQQQSDGTWIGRWYDGPFYMLHVAMRLFAAIDPRSPVIERALRFLREAQRAEGGFGLAGQETDALSTALGLLALAEGHAAAGSPEDLDRAASGLAVLRRSKGAEAGWPAQKLIFKGCRAYHGSRTLTTAFVLKAALAWHALAASAASSGSSGKAA